MITDSKTILFHIAENNSLQNKTIKGIDFTDLELEWSHISVENTFFLGCTFSRDLACNLMEKGACIVSKPPELPYDPFRHTLYHWQELGVGAKDSRDYAIYAHFSKGRWHPSAHEALWQRVHDHAIDEALRDFIQLGEDGVPGKKCVGIMGGHSTSRNDPNFLKVAEIARDLTEKGFMVVSGGGPGIMEAANLGAALAGQDTTSVEEAVKYLGGAPEYMDSHYVDTAIEVTSQLAPLTQSLAIPTWFYGHEPSNVFSSHIAKYFSNSIREDTLLAICLWGVIFAPGSAGTVQEIFMDACQNHYGTFRYYSPMIFLGEKHYKEDTLVYPALQKLSKGKAYNSYLMVTDNTNEVVDFVMNKAPVSLK